MTGPVMTVIVEQSTKNRRRTSEETMEFEWIDDLGDLELPPPEPSDDDPGREQQRMRLHSRAMPDRHEPGATA
jgi:hypothetical protein